MRCMRCGNLCNSPQKSKKLIYDHFRDVLAITALISFSWFVQFRCKSHIVNFLENSSSVDLSEVLQSIIHPLKCAHKI